MKYDFVYLRHILEAIQTIEEHLGGFSKNNFIQDKKTIDAVVRELEIIGEAANNLSERFKQDHPEIPFRDIIDMRNLLIHSYFGVNVDIVWDTCQENLPGLKRLLESITSKH